MPPASPFTTPPARRAALFDEAKALYSAEAPDSQKILFRGITAPFVKGGGGAKKEVMDMIHWHVESLAPLS